MSYRRLKNDQSLLFNLMSFSTGLDCAVWHHIDLYRPIGYTGYKPYIDAFLPYLITHIWLTKAIPIDLYWQNLGNITLLDLGKCG